MSNFAYSLSKGEQQKTVIARALLMKPTVILADEPASSLDTVMTDRVLRILKSAQKILGSTVVLATHDLNLAKRADQLLYMENGALKTYEPQR
ncbi:AAA family ATPase [Faecalibaculum rodentium]|uniref:AAA family ATPase n=1 Tax=Faecalibaculum rodentium TaxID=1702221 RepID=UPI0023F2B287|nr:ATP-binding cassette domain-containing protein [Faecalibaculum rodentium]